MTPDPAGDHIRRYYGAGGDYLREHRMFLRASDLEAEVAFIERALSLTSADTILDVACGQGRHAHAFARKGYWVDGVDFSAHLIDLARASGAAPGWRRPEFDVAEVTELPHRRRYTKAYWFFSDLAGIDGPRAIAAVGRCLKPGGRFLLDVDNIFRLAAYLARTPESPLTFDAERLELVDPDSGGLRVPYPVVPMWRDWFRRASCRVEAVFGDYQFGPYSLTSPRLILVVRKASKPT